MEDGCLVSGGLSVEQVERMDRIKRVAGWGGRPMTRQ